jgi:hypothetical protein
MTKTDSYFVNLGHAIIDYLLKLVGGKVLRDKIGHVTYFELKLSWFSHILLKPQLSNIFLTAFIQGISKPFLHAVNMRIYK